MKLQIVESLLSAASSLAGALMYVYSVNDKIKPARLFIIIIIAATLGPYSYYVVLKAFNSVEYAYTVGLFVGFVGPPLIKFMSNVLHYCVKNFDELILLTVSAINKWINRK